MAGILGSKERVLDTVLTKEGLKQAGTGRLKAEYVSFTDSQATYAVDTLVSGGLDATYRLMLEAGNSIQDMITLEADDAGFIHASLVSGSSGFTVARGQVLSGSSVLSGSQFASLAGTLLSSSIDNFRNLYILKSPDPTDSSERHFEIGPDELKFIISNNRPIPESDIQEAMVDNLESFFYDRRLSHIPNFQFMPPVNSDDGSLLGVYHNLNQEPILTYEDVAEEVRQYEESGFAETVRFYETSNQSNIFGQFFELSNDSVLKKLDVIDFGEFQTDEGMKQVFFVGKVFRDSLGAHTFINMFTLVFE